MALSVLLFFGVGFYESFVAKNAEVELSTPLIAGLRYAVLLLSLGIAASIFISEEKKEKPFKHIIAEELKPKEMPKPIAPEKELKPEFHGTFMPKVMEEENKKPAGITWPDEKSKEQKAPPAPPSPMPQTPPQAPIQTPPQTPPQTQNQQTPQAPQWNRQ